jgi:GT2 family glycosyltransferase
MSREPVTLDAIVVAWNRLADLRCCLESLLRQEIPDGLEFGIVVIDDGSSDGTAEWLAELAGREPRVRAYQLPRNHGPGVARNAALRLSEARYVLLLDSDAEIESPTLAARLTAAMEEDATLAVAGPVIWYGREHARPFIKGGYLTRNLHADLPRWWSETAAPHFVTSCCSVWRRSAIDEAGGFDPFYGHGIEDVDVCLRIVRSGGGLRVFEDLHAIHWMTNAGRRRPYDDFVRVFDYLEWTRPYLHLRVYGLCSTLRAAAHWCHANAEFDAAYGRRLSMRQRLLAQWVFPALHLLLHPWFRWVAWRKVPLRSAPKARALLPAQTRAPLSRAN